MSLKPVLSCALIPLLLSAVLHAEPPDPLAGPDGKPVKDAATWRKQVRPETLRKFRESVYGIRPVDRPEYFATRVVREDPKALEGAATLREIEITFSGPNGQGRIRPVILTPNSTEKPVGLFLLIGFVDPDPTDPKSNWNAKDIISRGYATASFNFNDVDPDRPDGFKDGVRAIYGKEPLAPDAWGELSSWGWGASRVMDFLLTDPKVDPRRVAIVGHSRAGKAALWCGAEDERFSLVISNGSGCGGAGLARGKKGERIANITYSFPRWFCGNYKNYADNEESLPIDQHQLLGLIAPRLLYVSSATEDVWADPESEFRSCVLATPVYKLFGKKGLATDTMPEPNKSSHGGTIGYHIRTGKHDLTAPDWRRYMDFADKQWPK